MKTTPEAVPGGCLTKASPAVFTHEPFGQSSKSTARKYPLLPSAFRRKPHRMWTRRNTTHCVVCDQPLLWCHRPQRRFARLLTEPLALLHEQWSFRSSRTFDLPKCIASVFHAIKRIQRADIRQQREFLAIELRHTQNEIIDRRVPSLRSGSDNAFCTLRFCERHHWCICCGCLVGRAQQRIFLATA